MKKVLLFAVAAATLFASCAKDGNTNGNEEVKYGALTLKVGKIGAPQTKSHDAASFDSSADVITLTNAYVMVFDRNTTRLLAKQSFSDATDITALRGTGVTMTSLVPSNGVVLVYGNVEATSTFATKFASATDFAVGKDTGVEFSTVVALADDMSTQTDYKGAILGNVAAAATGLTDGDMAVMTQGADATHFETTVSISPLISRVELGFISASATPSNMPNNTPAGSDWVVESFEVDSIYVSDFAKKFNYAGVYSTDATDIYNYDNSLGSTANYTAVTGFFDGYGDLMTPAVSSTTTQYAGSPVAVDVSGSGATKRYPAYATVDGTTYGTTLVPNHVWSYNVAAGYAPHIVIVMKNIVCRNLADTNAATNHQTIAGNAGEVGYLTIKSFKNGSTTLTGLERGKIYSIGKNGMAFQPKDITGAPDAEAPEVNLSVTVDIQEWTLVDTNVSVEP